METSMTASQPWYAIANASEVASPTVLVYPDRVEHNLKRMIELVGGDPARLRPHVKTHKLAPIVAMKLANGIRKFKVSTIAEAEMTAQAGGPDILLAHQPSGPGIARLIALMRAYPAVTWSTIVDDADNLRAIGEAVQAAGLTLTLYVDLNVGMNRTGIVPGDTAAALYAQLCRTPGITPGGLHAYDGHLRDPDDAALEALVRATFAPVWALRERLLAQGLPVPRLIASGTPTFAILARTPGIDVEVGAGTTALWDFGQEQVCPSHRMQNAAVLLARVISKPTPDRLCLDLGHKAVGSEMVHPRAQFYGLEDAQAVVHSEEHLVLQTPRAAQYRVGDIVYGVPRHICPTMALHSEVWAVREGQAAERWPVTARARRLTI
jgi:D-serine deaminase-like pyridoxal phosphate-dependent protein